MPTYEYGCSNCGHEWELEQRMSENPIRKCPKCKKLKAKRLISGTSFILKGGGWYADAYQKPPAGASKDAGSESKSESKSDSTKSSVAPAKSESKPKKKAPKKKKGAA